MYIYEIILRIWLEALKNIFDSPNKFLRKEMEIENFRMKRKLWKIFNFFSYLKNSLKPLSSLKPTRNIS
jgi:hypothetical protein